MWASRSLFRKESFVILQPQKFDIEDLVLQRYLVD